MRTRLSCGHQTSARMGIRLARLRTSIADQEAPRAARGDERVWPARSGQITAEPEPAIAQVDNRGNDVSAVWSARQDQVE